MTDGRRLVIETDGGAIGIIECQLTPLELRSVFQMLLEAVERGQFPYPSRLEAKTDE